VCFLSLVREQVLTLQKYSSLPELSDLLTSFALVLVLLLVLLKMVFNGVDNTEASVIPSALSTVVVGLLRLQTKAILIEKITEEVIITRLQKY